MASDFTDLCKRIQHHCQRRQWYGSDAEYDMWVAHGRAGPYVYFGSGPEAGDVIEPPVERFARTPATAEQIAHTEQVVGHELPSVLKAVYLSVANGDFGPGYGLEGVGSLTAVTRTGWRLSERAAHYLGAHPRRYLESDQVPNGLVQLCDWGCGLASMLDLNSRRVYGLGCGRRSDWNGAEPGVDDIVQWIDFQATSIEEWFERWLCGVLEQPLLHVEGYEEPSEPDEWSTDPQDEDR